MKRFLVILFIMIFFPLQAFCDLELRDYDGIEVPVGTFIPVINTEEISTLYSQEGKVIKFISTNDIYMFETNIIPQHTEFYGVVQKVFEPVVGTNGGMIIRITKLVLPDGFEIPIRGYIYSQNQNIIGRTIAAPKEYIKVPHYQKGFWLGTTQWVPSGMLRMGKHLTIAAGAELTIVLAAPTYITHTLTN